jgi:hypothetical protein
MSLSINEIGNRYGHLTVTDDAANALGDSVVVSYTDGYRRFVCECDCGNTVIVKGQHLRSGHTVSCGCARQGVLGPARAKELLKRPYNWQGKPVGPNFVDRTDETYGALKVLHRVSNSKRGLSMWLCICACGNLTVVSGSDIQQRHTLSCGCQRTARRAWTVERATLLAEGEQARAFLREVNNAQAQARTS